MAALQKAADFCGLGWLTRGLGSLLLLLVGVLLSPLLVGYYLSPYKLSLDKFYFDEIYDTLLVRPLRFFAAAAYALDRWLVDGCVNWVGRVPVHVGGALRKLQGGLSPSYGLAMILGTLVLIAARMIWGS